MVLNVGSCAWSVVSRCGRARKYFESDVKTTVSLREEGIVRMAMESTCFLFMHAYKKPDSFGESCSSPPPLENFPPFTFLRTSWLSFWDVHLFPPFSRAIKKKGWDLYSSSFLPLPTYNRPLKPAAVSSFFFLLLLLHFLEVKRRGRIEEKEQGDRGRSFSKRNRAKLNSQKHSGFQIELYEKPSFL